MASLHPYLSRNRGPLRASFLVVVIRQDDVQVLRRPVEAFAELLGELPGIHPGPRAEELRGFPVMTKKEGPRGPKGRTEPVAEHGEKGERGPAGPPPSRPPSSRRLKNNWATSASSSRFNSPDSGSFRCSSFTLKSFEATDRPVPLSASAPPMALPSRPRLTRKKSSKADAAETFERIIPRQQLKIQSGDVVMTRSRGPLGQDSYDLPVTGEINAPERFATFEHAAARGELLAMEKHARFFFVESDNEPPFLLKDARRS